jgi:uncharacterized protein involved in type VI secretion and phage assembly
MSVRPDGGLAVYYGLYPATVSDSAPDELGRVEIELPWLGTNPRDEAGQRGDQGEPVRVRATLLSSWAGADQGLLAIPARETQVIVGFEAGNLARAYIVGACWNGVAPMPHQGAAASGRSTRATEDRRVLRTRAGHHIELDDTEGSTKLTVASAKGHKLVLDDDASSITITHADGHTITLDAGGGVTITASTTLTVNAPSGVTVTAPSALFSGLVQCTNLVATASVVSPSYTPGIGNLL